MGMPLNWPEVRTVPAIDAGRPFHRDTLLPMIPRVRSARQSAIVVGLVGGLGRRLPECKLFGNVA
eukprot:6873704-Prorocentrum_lima.AAC.1